MGFVFYRRDDALKPIRIPRRIDDPPHLLLWSADELAPVLIGVLAGVFFEQMGVCVIIGFALAHLYRKYRDNHLDGYLFHILYWWGLMFTRAKTMKNPFIRRFIS